MNNFSTTFLRRIKNSNMADGWNLEFTLHFMERTHEPLHLGLTKFCAMKDSWHTYFSNRPFKYGGELFVAFAMSCLYTITWQWRNTDLIIGEFTAHLFKSEPLLRETDFSQNFKTCYVFHTPSLQWVPEVHSPGRKARKCRKLNTVTCIIPWPMNDREVIIKQWYYFL
jgi:hypothetical protein